MSYKYQEHLSIGIQFIFDPDTNKIKTRVSGSETDLEIYRITPKGRVFVGKKGLVDTLWLRVFDPLCENTAYTVTFYNESHTKAMMPDRLAGNLSDLMIAYNRVYMCLKDQINFGTDPILHNNWKKRIDYNPDPGQTVIPPNIKKTGNDPYIDPDQQLLFYPFLLKPKSYPDILRYYKDIEDLSREKINISNGYTIIYTSSFPNVEIDKFNILLGL